MDPYHYIVLLPISANNYCTIYIHYLDWNDLQVLTFRCCCWKEAHHVKTFTHITHKLIPSWTSVQIKPLLKTSALPSASAIRLWSCFSYDYICIFVPFTCKVNKSLIVDSLFQGRQDFWCKDYCWRTRYSKAIILFRNKIIQSNTTELLLQYWLPKVEDLCYHKDYVKFQCICQFWVLHWCLYSCSRSIWLSLTS